MSPVSLGQPLGIDGVQQRMAEIGQELGLDSQPAADAAPATASSAFGGDFNAALQGAIGGAGQDGAGSFMPVIPGQGGTEISKGIPAGLKSLIQSAAMSNGLDPALLASLVKQESGFDPQSRSRAGAMGLTQLMPGTAAELGVSSPFDPAQNLNGGARYLKGLIGKFGSIPLALAAYNAGPGAVSRFGGIPPYAETKNYVKSIMAMYRSGGPS